MRSCSALTAVDLTRRVADPRTFVVNALDRMEARRAGGDRGSARSRWPGVERDAQRAVGGEGLAAPAGPAVAQLKAGQPGHQVEFGRARRSG